MLKEQFDRLNHEQKSLISISYLLTKPELWPEESKKFFEKLIDYDKTASNIQASINQAKKSINDLQSQFHQTVGSITAISNIIADYIPEEKFEEYCIGFDLPGQLSQPENKNVPIDMAGSTSKTLPIPEKK